MRKLGLSIAGIIVALSFGGTAEAGCSGGVGSTDLSCTSNAGTLNDYKTWAQSVYLPAAISKAMSSFSIAFAAANDPHMFGYSQVADEWGPFSNRSMFTSNLNFSRSPWYVANSTTTTKGSLSDFIVDGLTANNFGANAWLELNWTGTVSQVIDGATNYLAQYNYTFHADSWAGSFANGTISLNGSGTYNLTKSVQAVPGPEAGAGIGGLAFCAMTLWVKRRRAIHIV
ncbi:hypothetical protein [Rhizobium sp. BE258]|uniref:hypothetical protein n=1 Tax=Rhizobium sp. BE258 TaxID=2817722 RepID=UPI0028620982|nr:hypothetical protein [Rhizobium sp. BE258]MDR7145228.1 hypothetical protein [Rhizobium sp. BE258]